MRESRSGAEAERQSRLFIAIDLPVDVKERLADMQTRLKTGCRFVDAHPRWVTVDNLHLTVVFLGAVPESAIPVVQEIMDFVCADFGAFEMTVSRLGLFPPDSKDPKVLSVDAGSPERSLQRLYKKLSGELDSAGFLLQDRPYKPHLTLARLTSVKSASRLAPLVASHAGMLNVKFPVNEVVLFESRLGHDGPTYTGLHKATLSQTQA